jgi:hypothetical protein
MKYSEEFVINYYKQRGCELLEPYTNTNAPLKYLCKCGRISQNSFYFFRKAFNCLYCRKARKLSTQNVDTEVAKSGCTLLENNYNNARTKMKIKCSCGNIFLISWGNFNSGKRCKACGTLKKKKARKLDYNYVKKYFEINGCKLLSANYENSYEKLDYICKCGRQSVITYNNFQRGRRCLQCRIEKKKGKYGDQKFKQRCRAILGNSLRSLGKQKTNHTEIMLGYNGDQLKNHIVNHPNWNIVKNYKWEIDHIFPIKAFCDYNILDIKLINCLENLQPLTGKDNLSKSDKYNKEEFEKWLSLKGISI